MGGMRLMGLMGLISPMSPISPIRLPLLLLNGFLFRIAADGGVVIREELADERPVMKWNGNPFVVDGGAGGHGEDDGAAFLLPYWMGRYYGFIAADE